MAKKGQGDITPNAKIQKFPNRMQEFMTYFLEGRREEDITCDAMHMELYLFMKKRFDTVAELHEFAYAFICSLEVRLTLLHELDCAK